MALTTSMTIAGNLTQDPELAYSQAGKPFCRVSIAVNPRQFDQATREWKDGEPVFWRGTVFGDIAEHVAHSLTKGNRVIAHGTVKTDSWTDKDSGTKRTAMTMQIEDIGPSLMYMNATPSKSAPSGQAQAASQDGWAQPAAVGDDTPF